MTFLTNQRIATKIGAIVVGLALILVVFVVYLTHTMKKIDHQHAVLLSDTSEGELAAARATLRASMMGYQALRVVAEDGPTTTAMAAVDAHAEAFREFRDFLTKAAAALPAHQAAFARLGQIGDNVEKQTNVAIQHALKNEDAAAKRAMAVADQEIAKATAAARVLYASLATSVRETSNTLTAEIVATSVFMLVLGIAIGILGIAAALLVSSKTITGPLGRLQIRMRDLASGQLEIEIEGQDRRDEIGAMAKAIQVFKDSALRARRIEAEAEEARVRTDAERVRNEADRAAVAEQQSRVVSDLASGLAGLAAGDLTGRVASFPEEYRKLEHDFNAAIETLQETITVIAGNGQGIRSGSGEISQAADDLSRRTEQQAASLEETAAALEEITATVRKTAEGARHARDVVSGAKAEAERSGQVVRDAVVAMGAIEKSAQEISQIIGVIDEIAFQTNLLALNAGVEAARAGDAGRGFAVVASEVRALAQRSAEAAKEIKGLISTSSSQVASGVTLVGETGKALSRIVSQVNEITGIVAEISASAQEQAAGLSQVNTAVNQMDQMTQQNAAMVEESTAASHSLVGEAEQLAQLIARFRTGREGIPATGRRPTRSAAA